MFLRKLFFFDKKIFFLFIIYFVAFLFINYKWGLTVSPIMQYGMYSGISKLSDTIFINRVYVNDTLLNFSKLSMADRDIIDIDIDNFYSERDINKIVYATFKRITGAENIMKEEVYLNNITDQVFYNRIKKRIGNITNKKINNLKILKQKYVWKDDVLFEVQN